MMERFLFGSFHIYDTRRDNDTVLLIRYHLCVDYNAIDILLKDSCIPDFSSLKEQIFVKPLRIQQKPCFEFL